MKIKLLTSALLLFVCTMLHAQKKNTFEAHLSYQYFNNFGDLANTRPIVAGVSKFGQSFTLGIDYLRKNTGLRVETSHLKFESNEELDTYQYLRDQGIIYALDPPSGVTHTNGATTKSEYEFSFRSISFGLVHKINLNKLRLGISAGYGKLSPRSRGNTGPLNSDNGLDIYDVIIQTTNVATDDEHFYFFEQSAQYLGGNYFNGSLELDYNVFKGARVFAGLNYKNGHFKYQIDKQEITASSNWQTTDLEKLKFQSLGLNVGLMFTFQYGKAIFEN